MEQRQLGSTGLRVSSLGLGTLTWSRDTDTADAADQLVTFADAGGTLVDTSASYADGGAELLLGELLSGTIRRDEIVICTKAGVRQTAAGGVVDSSRASVIASVDASLRRLGTDHVDVLLVQSPDPRTPPEEVASALRLAVASGRARYVGLSNHPGWLTTRIASLLAGDPGLAAVEVEYSLLERGIEREVTPAAAALGIGVLAWSPLGRGVLTGKYQRTIPADSRAASPHLAGFVEPYLGPGAHAIVDAVVTAAKGLGTTPLAVALAWLTGRGVASAIVGSRTAAQLRASIDAADLVLPPQITAALDEVSAPTLGYPERR